MPIDSSSGSDAGRAAIRPLARRRDRRRSGRPVGRRLASLTPSPSNAGGRRLVALHRLRRRYSVPSPSQSQRYSLRHSHSATLSVAIGTPPSPSQSQSGRFRRSHGAPVPVAVVPSPPRLRAVASPSGRRDSRSAGGRGQCSSALACLARSTFTPPHSRHVAISSCGLAKYSSPQLWQTWDGSGASASSGSSLPSRRWTVSLMLTVDPDNGWIADVFNRNRRERRRALDFLSRS